MLGKIEIFAVIIFLVILFYLVISFGAGLFSKKKNPEVKKYLRSVNILLIFIAIIGTILIFFL